MAVSLGAIATNQPSGALHLAILLLMLVVVTSTEIRGNPSLPIVVRPGIAFAASIVVGSVGAGSLSSHDYVEYISLLAPLAFGASVASIVFTGYEARSLAIRSPGVFRASTATNIAKVLFAVSVFSALFFFAWQGIPALGPDVEQGRVDAAVEGSGYVRLLAYMSIPAAHILFAMRVRWAWISVAVTLMIILALANRSPLLYLFIPLVFILFGQRRIKLTSSRLAVLAATLVGLVGSIGASRIFSQAEFASYAEYRSDIASGNFLGVMLTSLGHYTRVVPENGVLTKALVDDGSLPLQFGSTYFTLFISALPGEQLSLDRLIRSVSSSSFVGGGIPPTLAGEAYVNFGYIGVFAIGFVCVALLKKFSADVAMGVAAPEHQRIFGFAAYGYFFCWIVGSPVAGLAGASTVSLAGALVLVVVKIVAESRGRLEQ